MSLHASTRYTTASSTASTVRALAASKDGIAHC